MTKSEQIAELQKEVVMLKEALQQQMHYMTTLRDDFQAFESKFEIIEEILEVGE